MPAEPAGGWQRLHPVTIIRELLGVAWNVVIAVFAFGALSGDALGQIEIAVPVVFLGVAVGRYLSTRYLITPEAVLWRRGIVFRRRVEVPRTRIQNVSSGADVIGRVFGLRTVTISTAGSEGEIELALVSSEEASFLLAELLGRGAAVGGAHADRAGPAGATSGLAPFPAPRAVSGAGAPPAGALPPGHNPPPPAGAPVAWLSPPPPGTGTVAAAPAPGPPTSRPDLPPPPSRRLVSLPTAQLVRYALTGSGLGVLVAVFAVVVFALVTGSPGPLPVVLLLSAAPVVAVLDLVDFELSAETDRIRVRHGLLKTRDKWARRERVQLMAVERPVVRAKLGYETISVATADATVASDSALSLCHPLADRGSWHWLAGEILEPVEVTEASLRPISPRALVRRTVRLSMAMGAVVAPPLLVVAVVAGSAAGLVALALAALAVLVAARRLAARAQRFDGWTLDDQHLLVRRGMLGSRLWLVRRAKVQSASVVATPFQRRLGLASLLVDTANVSGAAIVVPDLPRGDAEDLAVQLVQLADRVFLPDGV